MIPRQASRTLVCLVAAGVAAFVPSAGVAQEGRDAAAAWGGGAFGAASGVALGLVAGVAPCSLTLRGTRCARVAAALGALVGSTSGAVLAYHDPGAVRDRLLGAGIGAALGAALGLGARAAVPQIGAPDVATIAVVGGAVGAVPVGAAVGLGTGLLVGSALWLAVPEDGLPTALALGTVGLAIGGLLEWTYAAVDGAGEARPVQAQLTWRF